MEILCLDLEGVLVPEIWINVAERTGIDELRATTRDIPDYDVLMRQRLEILEEHGLKIGDIQSVIAKMGPMDGARRRSNGCARSADASASALDYALKSPRPRSCALTTD